MSAKKKPSEATTALVTVEVIRQGLYENGAVHTKGMRFQTTPERAAALAALVKTVES